MPEKEQKSLREYWNLLASHDWYYDYTESHAKWTRGFNERSTLTRFKSQSPEHQKMYDDFYEHYFKDGRPLPPKPE